MPHITLARARAAKALALDRFGPLAHVVGVGITRVNDQYAVKVNLREPARPGVTLPTDIDGVPVKIEVTGTLRPRPAR